jgi:hexosaminidase
MKIQFIKILTLVLAFVCLTFVAFGQGTKSMSHNLMPVPKSVEWKSGKLRLTKDFKVVTKGKVDERLKNYIFRVMRRLEGRTVMSFSREYAKDSARAGLLIETKSTGSKIPKLGEDESYQLEIKENQAKLTANTNVGAMRGLETFLQLLKGDKDGFYFPEVEINDEPRFPWRGLLIDVARHYQPMDVLKRNIDGMAAVKLNVLHWHLTEDQGFRVESKKFPKLHGMGSDGLFYTQKEIREIIDYAADRGIRVMPEFDMPGHATAWVVGYPELASLPGPYEIERDPGIFDPTLNPIKEETYKFLDVFLTEMAGLFPDDYMHIGGDENEGKQWDANPEIQAFMKKNGIKDNHELQTYFNKRILKFLQKNKKIMMGWDEIFQPDLPKEVVIHSWRGQESLAEAANKGFTGILSNGYYIDLMYPASEHYLVDPIPSDTKLSPAEQKRVLGGEATMWSEWVSPETIDSRIWSRMPAIAERLWSPQNVRDVGDMYRRLDIIKVQLEELGLTHNRNQKVLLRRLTAGKDISALQTLVDLIEPVKQYQRYQQRKQTMLDPLTGLIDAALPDARGAREFNASAELLSGGKDRENLNNLKNVFSSWEETGNRLKDQIENSPALHEAKQLAVDLEMLGKIGLEIVSYYETNKKPEKSWQEETLKKLEEIKKPKAALEFMVIESMKKMVQALSSN